jgi:hypothetical protein
VSEPKVGALCGNAARRDLRGGWRATAIPTATLFLNQTLLFCDFKKLVLPVAYFQWCEEASGAIAA